VFIRFVDIGGIDDLHCKDFLLRHDMFVFFVLSGTSNFNKHTSNINYINPQNQKKNTSKPLPLKKIKIKTKWNACQFKHLAYPMKVIADWLIDWFVGA
jgi:hypothetical protein